MKEKDPNYVKPDECPSCFYQMDCATVINGKPARPNPGDYSLCLNCVAVARYDEKMNVCAATEDDMDKLDAR